MTEKTTNALSQMNVRYANKNPIKRFENVEDIVLGKNKFLSIKLKIKLIPALKE